MNGLPTVFVVDDEEMIRNLFERILRSVGLDVMTFASPQDLLDRPVLGDSGCVILDLVLPGMSGLDLWRRLVAQGCSRPFILMSGHGDIQIAVRAFREGILDFLEKPLRRQDVIDCVEQALAHDAQARRRQAARDPVQARFETLTAREKEIFGLIHQGLGTKQISRDLVISPKTVDVHRSNIFKKMQVNSLAELLQLMYRLGSDDRPANSLSLRAA